MFEAGTSVWGEMRLEQESEEALTLKSLSLILRTTPKM